LTDRDKQDGMEQKLVKIEDIRAQVESRVAEENKTGSGPGDSGPDHNFVWSCIQANQLGDGELYKRINAGKFIFCKSMDCWLRWAGNHWELDTMDGAFAAVEEVVKRYQAAADLERKKAQESKDDKELQKYHESRERKLSKRVWDLRGDQRRTQCAKWAHTSKNPMAIHGDEIDRQPWLLACPNCVVDLKTGESRPGQPDDFLLKAAPTEWRGIDAPRPTWEEALLEIHSRDELVVEFMQRLYGCAIVGAVYEHIFPVFTGPGGRNGKGTEMEAIKTVLGPLAGPIPSEMLLASYKITNSSAPTPDIVAMRGLRIAWASETEDGAKVSAAKCKWLTGADSLTGRSPHDKYPITFAPSHTLFLLSNFKPHADSQDQAFWERVINIPFLVRFLRNSEPKADNERVADPMLQQKLQEEAPGILAWMVEGCLKWQRDGLMMPPRVVEETQKWKSGEDNLGAFIEFCCRTGDETEFQIGASDLYDAFTAWWKKFVGNFPPKQKKFGSYVRERFRHDKVGGLYKYFGLALDLRVMREILPDQYGGDVW